MYGWAAPSWVANHNALAGNRLTTEQLLRESVRWSRAPYNPAVPTSTGIVATGVAAVSYLNPATSRIGPG